MQAFLSSASSALAAAQKGSLSSNYAPDPSGPPPLAVGVWRVQRAKHASNGKLVSIWTADKGTLLSAGAGGGAAGRRGGAGRDRAHDAERLKLAIDVLKKEVRTL